MPDKQRSRASRKTSAKDGKSAQSRSAIRGPRPFWSGNVAFGLVNLPVGLYPAQRAKPLSLRMVDEEGTPLTRRYFCEREERALSADDLVRGYEVEKDEFVLVEDEELRSLAPEKSQEIDLKRFVALADIDPLYFERAYFLTPEKGATKAYRLLARSMEESARAGIATFVMRDREYLVAIIAEDGILRAETLRFADEVRSPADVGLDLSNVEAESKRVRALEKAIDSLSTERFDREELEDRQSQRTLERIDEKLEANDDVIELRGEGEVEEQEEGGEVVDLMQVLKQSLEEGRSPVAERETRAASGDADKRKQGRASGSPRKQGKKAASRGKRKEGNTSSSRREQEKHDLSALSRDELYARAQELELPGRSRMTKKELVEAIAGAA
ncbi:DNA end-binding protein Ku [Modicisalibacter ilicicola DSM 19980]|uniref:Non-homologous end joining protein Ku n=1 Tax=Modicisalibacter ilicicola DSM 19980 TaxID=1121942 RepID=A0A1M5BSW6_9GAMM|nr:Ku protein [Halomonas ilicicola]SHF45367.1 DNA end-binding protein Ku [Halomonas ilicicola DSM 19980]